SRSRPPRRSKPASRLTPEQRIADILAAARILLAEKGYDACTTADIAERAGVVEGTIYRYFESKRELFTKLAEQWFGELLTARAAPPPGADIRTRLRSAIADALSIIRHERALSKFVLMELRPDPNYRSMEVYRLNQAYTAGVLEVLKDAERAGQIDPALPVTLLRDMIFGAIEHRTWAFLREEGDFFVDEVADAITKVVFRGMQSVVPHAPDLSQVVARLEASIAKLDHR
ncbi:TetR/AcrR family transcriptional regulator, partial [Sphingomonas sp. CCH9-H8]